MKIQYMNVCVCSAFTFLCVCVCVLIRAFAWKSRKSCTESRAMQEGPTAPSHSALMLEQRAGAATTLSSSALLWHLPAPCKSCQDWEIYSQRSALACLFISTLQQQPECRLLLPQPGVINVLLILQTRASPFYLNLIKVASCLWPGSLM